MARGGVGANKVAIKNPMFLIGGRDAMPRRAGAGHFSPRQVRVRICPES